MKIGIVCYPTYGGSGVVATELGKSLAKKGHQVHFITYSQPVRLDAYGSNLFFHEVSILKYPLFEYPPYELALISKLVDVIEFEQLDLLHVHYAIPHAFAAYMAKQMLHKKGYRLPIITTLHGTDITLVGKDPSFETAVTFSINHSDAVTAVSEYLRKETFEHFDVNKDIRVIPNFIDISSFHRKKKEHFRQALAPHGEKVICHISNFRKVKRVSDVIRIFSKVRERTPAKLLLVGDGPERNKAEGICRQLEYCGDVRFLGKVDAVEEVLSISDLFVLPSETESFGLAALEAMACEVPVIASDAGGLPELVEDGKSGFTCPVGDVDQMAEKALYIFEDKERFEAFKKASFERAKAFDISEVMPQYEKLYEELLTAVVE